MIRSSPDAGMTSCGPWGTEIILKTCTSRAERPFAPVVAVRHFVANDAAARDTRHLVFVALLAVVGAPVIAVGIVHQLFFGSYILDSGSPIRG
jgi:hypothetical protein